MDGCYARIEMPRGRLAVHVATDGRCQRGEIVRGLYLVDEPATAIAEWLPPACRTRAAARTSHPPD
jgi:hypothetical protein